jgi:hypothetical protein
MRNVPHRDAILAVAKALPPHLRDQTLPDIVAGLTKDEDWLQPVSSAEVAAYLGITNNHLATIRGRGEGPPGWNRELKRYTGGMLSVVKWLQNDDEVAA